MRSAHRSLFVVGAALVAALSITDVVTLGQGQASNEFPNPYKIETWGQLPAGRKIDVDPPPLIHTVRGFGYTIRAPEASP